MMLFIPSSTSPRLRARLRFAAAASLVLAAVVATSCAAPAPTATSPPTRVDAPSPTVAPAEPSPTGPSPSTVTERPASRPTPSPSPGPGDVGYQAPEFQGVANWINSAPLRMDGLRGKVVLIDFWTYTCVNCIRTFPYLRDWHAKYADKGLVIVGVHSPEFEFEKVTANVTRAVRQFDLDYAIAQDNDFQTWRSYDNRYWPAKYLIDKAGVIRYHHFGEGGYVETEREIRRLLEDAGADLAGIPLNDAPEPEVHEEAFDPDPRYRLTREIYGGYARNNTFGGIYVAQPEYYAAPDRVLTYEDPGDHVNQFIYLHGPWENGDEALRHARATEQFEDYVALKFFATSVNAVIHPTRDDPFDVRVLLDGRPLRQDEAGRDVKIEGGRSYFVVGEPRLYEVVRLPDYDAHELRLSANSDAFALYALTFGAYPTGP